MRWLNSPGSHLKGEKKSGCFQKATGKEWDWHRLSYMIRMCLILDEPTTGLDPNQLVEIRNLISGLGKHKTVMLSTHIMQEVEAICKRVIIISKGKIMANDLTGNIAGHVIGSPHTIVIEFSKDPDDIVFREITAIELTKKLKTRHLAISNQG